MVKSTLAQFPFFRWQSSGLALLSASEIPLKELDVQIRNIDVFDEKKKLGDWKEGFPEGG